MINEDKILELITSENLSDEQLKELKEICENDPKAAKLVFINNAISKVVKNVHPGVDILAEYVLVKNSNSENSSKIEYLESQIKEHLQNCTKCSEIYNELNNEYSEVYSHISESYSEKSELPKETKFVQFNKFIYSFSAAAVIVFCLFLFDKFSTDNLFESAYDFEIETNYLTRSEVNPDYDDAVMLMKTGEYDGAIRKFERYIVENDTNDMIFYDHFLLGKLYITSAKEDLMGFFKSTDVDRIKKGITHLKKTISLNRSERHYNISLDAEFYIGLGYIYLNDKPNAKKYLQAVIEKRGGFANEASEFLTQIEN